MFSAAKLFIATYRIWFQLAAIAALVGGAWWGIHNYNESLREEGRAEIRQEYQIKLLQAYKDKAAIEDGWKKQKEKSDENARKRQETLAANLATAALINSGLRDDVDSLRQRLSDPSIGATADGAVTIKAVLGECARELESYAGKNTQLATSCDRHVNDLQRYHEQWPKVNGTQ